MNTLVTRDRLAGKRGVRMTSSRVYGESLHRHHLGENSVKAVNDILKAALRHFW